MPCCPSIKVVLDCNDCQAWPGVPGSIDAAFQVKESANADASVFFLKEDSIYIFDMKTSSVTEIAKVFRSIACPSGGSRAYTLRSRP